MENTSEGAGLPPCSKGTGGWGGEQLAPRLQTLAQDYCHENHGLDVPAASFLFLPSALQLLFLCRVRPRSRLKFWGSHSCFCYLPHCSRKELQQMRQMHVTYIWSHEWRGGGWGGEGNGTRIRTYNRARSKANRKTHYRRLFLQQVGTHLNQLL